MKSFECETFWIRFKQFSFKFKTYCWHVFFNLEVIFSLETFWEDNFLINWSQILNLNANELIFWFCAVLININSIFWIYSQLKKCIVSQKLHSKERLNKVSIIKNVVSKSLNSEFFQCSLNFFEIINLVF